MCNFVGLRGRMFASEAFPVSSEVWYTWLLLPRISPATCRRVTTLGFSISATGTDSVYSAYIRSRRQQKRVGQPAATCSEHGGHGPPYRLVWHLCEKQLCRFDFEKRMGLQMCVTADCVISSNSKFFKFYERVKK